MWRALVAGELESTNPAFQVLDKLRIIETGPTDPALAQISTLSIMEIVRECRTSTPKIDEIAAYQHTIYTGVPRHMLWVKLTIFA